jgi:hypothetical protein
MVHNSTCKYTTPEARPPPKIATFPTDVAAKLERTPLSCAVDQVPSARAEPTAAVGGAADWDVGAVPLATVAGVAVVGSEVDMAGTATPATVSTGVKPAPAPKVDIEEVVAAAAELGVVRPETTHTTAASKASGVPRTICKLGEEYVGVIVPEMALPDLVHVAVGMPVKEAKPVNVITATAVVDAPVNPRVMEEAVEMTLLENETEADVKAPANITLELTPGAKNRITRHSLLKLF